MLKRGERKEGTRAAWRGTFAADVIAELLH